MNRTAFILWVIVFLIVGAALLLNLTGCSSPPPPEEGFLINDFWTWGRVYKLSDDGVTCYVYVGHGISCVERSQ